MTPDTEALKALNFVWGVTPVQVLAPENEPSHVNRAENFIEQEPAFPVGGSFVITAGEPKKGHQPRGTNMVKIYVK